MTNQDAKTIKLFQQLCKQGKLAALKLLQETYALTAEDASRENNLILSWAARNGHTFSYQRYEKNLDICKWLHATYGLTAQDARSYHNDAYQSAVMYDHLDVCKWLHETFDLTSEDARSNNNALRTAANHGHLDVCQWLVETFDLTASDIRSNNNHALRRAAYNGHLDICQWWLRDIASFKYTREELEAEKLDAKKELATWIRKETREAPPVLAPVQNVNADVIALLKEVQEKLEAKN